MLEEKYPEIEIVDAPYFYDAGVFNKSERAGCLLLTLDAWVGVHPALVTIPVEWDYRVPYGLIYSKTPRAACVCCLKASACDYIRSAASEARGERSHSPGSIVS